MNYQDMLARQGAGSAHPGGFAATLELLAHFPFRRGTRVLEVGCGTGRTACCLAGRGCEVTAMDIRPAMLKKAKIRAKAQGVKLKLTEGDATDIPFGNDSFDAVLVESVTVFTDCRSAIQEYYRVLRPGGKLYDREMMAAQRLPGHAAQSLEKLYGFKHLPTLNEWLTSLRAANFRKVGVWKPRAVPKDLSMAGEWAHPDPLQLTDQDLANDPQFHYMVLQNTNILGRYAEYLGYGVLMGTK